MDDIIGISKDRLKEAIVELIRRTSAVLPDDVVERLKTMRDLEEPESRARRTLDSIFTNIEMADKASRPICQDTGTVTFDIEYPFGMRQSDIEQAAKEAVRAATSKNYLRPNVVDSLSGEIKGDNVGAGHPAIYYDQSDGDVFKVMLALKGGGCENVGAQYSLPRPDMGAGRDLNGIKKVCLDAVETALGRGCAPGVLGIGIGGDRSQSYKLSKHQLHRKIDDVNPDPKLAELEEWLLEKGNKLGIGPMGFGGETTLFAVKAGVMDRIPASYFVAITYMCWAFRRRSMTIAKGEVSYD
ncbi:Fumarate hydratase class I, alpha region; L(+)-tartrate dehydratase alpha subunit [hydrothermal vent metagenome]|uniref:Fumarate hydratase class I, alpha region L(+)-tartrate dehydratase alpha subunit n=1 Tax=hydrothermal vent metagenome TaxID=652676 RepID=A0A3B1BSK3_9ZZZZ